MNDLVLLSYDYPPNDGGISRLAAAFSSGLAADGVAVEVCTLGGNATSEGLPRPELATVELPRSRIWREFALLRYLLSRPKNIRIITTVWNPEATLAWLLGRRNLYVLAHGNEVMPYPQGMTFRLKAWLRKKVLASARCVICNSRYTEHLVSSIAVDATTAVVNPGVDTAHFNVELTQDEARARLGLPQNKRLLLSVSRIDDYKGHDVVLDALVALTEEQRRQLHYVVAGKGGHLKALQRRASELGLEASISWLGFVADESLPLLYKAADLFVLCTREDKALRGVEGFGMVFLEAQAAGLAVVGTRAGGIPDAVREGRGGWLIDQDDSLAFGKHLETLLNRPEQVNEQGRLGQERARTECGWRQYTQNLLDVLEKY
ncbi:glycosyltransferase family 4 protein [Zobellella maritima]|uniref:glycosyltransferase family 4 protein n=1 Tax=Zobellella maritima TaxID=2059725 RepID=UPI000E302C7E|nr:glycosyltransferase family 4 protein [Zobellella maritima]